MKTSPLSLLKDPTLLKTDALVNGLWVKGAAGTRFDVRDPSTGARLADVANLGPADAEAAMLPVRSTQLSPGKVQRRVIPAPGLTALFLVGDDERSRAWLRQRQAALRELQAVGLVVNVESMAALTALRRLTPGLTLSPASGDDLAQRLGLRHYPVLITPTGVEQ